METVRLTEEIVMSLKGNGGAANRLDRSQVPSPAGGQQRIAAEGAEGQEAEGAEGQEAEGAEGQEAEGAEGQEAEGAEGQEAEGAEGQEAEGAEGQEAEGAEGQEAEDLGITDPGLKLRIAKRIGKEVAKTKALKQQLDEIGGKLAAAEDRLKNAQFIDKKTGLPFPSEYLSEQEVAQVTRQQKLENLEEFCLAHLAEGYQGDGSANDPGYTPQQLQATLARTTRELRQNQFNVFSIIQRAQTKFEEDLRIAKRTRGPDGKPIRRESSLPPRRPALPKLPGATRTASPPSQDGRRQAPGFNQKAVLDNPTREEFEKQLEQMNNLSG
jgi:hypothetical protein